MKPMKPVRAAFIAFLLLIVALPIVPTVAAEHGPWIGAEADDWTNGPWDDTGECGLTDSDEDNLGDADPPLSLCVGFGNSVSLPAQWVSGDSCGTRHYIGIEEPGTGESLLVFPSSGSGVAVTDTGSDNPGTHHDLICTSELTVHLCYIDQAADDVYYKKTTSGGALWAASVLVTSTNEIKTCSIAAFSSTVLLISYYDETATDTVVKKSTDGGATWGSPVTVSSVRGVLPNGQRDMDLVTKNATEAVLVFQPNSGSIQSCKTTDAAATWSCTAITGVAGDALRIDYDPDADRYIMAGEVSTADAIQYCRSSDAVSWECLQDIAGTQTELKAVNLGVIGEDWYGVVWSKQDFSGDPSHVFWYTETVDGGLSWSAAESLLTLSAGNFVGQGGLEYGGFPSLTSVECDEPLDTGGAVGDIGFFVHESGIRSLGPRSSATGAPHVTHPASLSMFSQYIEDSGTDSLCSYQMFVAGPGGPLDPVATATVTDLVGFDVDSTGSIAIARTELGENVRTYNAQTLGTSVSGTIDTNCAVGTNDYEDGVMARSLDSGGDAQLVGFLNCDASGDAQYLSIRQVDGSVPTQEQFNDCTPVDAGDVGCHYNIDLTDFDEPIDSALGQLGQVRDFPIDYSNQGSFLGSIVGRTAWAFASQQCASPPGPSYCSDLEPGYVGVATYTARVVDPANTDFKQHHPDQDVEDFCLGLDGGNYYLGSVVTGQPGHTWTVTFSETDGDALDATISNNPSSFVGAVGGIACGGGQILVTTADSVQLLTRTGTFLDEIDGISPTNRGLSLSEEFVGPEGAVADRGTTCTTALEATGDCLQFGVYVDGASAFIVNVTGGSFVEVGSITLPSGSFHSIRMDRLAQNIWVATSTTIQKFEVFSVTTGDPLNIPGDEDDGGALDGDGLFSNSGATVGAALGTGAFGGNLFLGAVLMGIVAYGVGIGYGNAIDSNSMQPRALRVNPWAAAVGAAMGFLLAWGFGFFSTAVVFSFVVLIAVVIGVRLWVGNRG